MKSLNKMILLVGFILIVFATECRYRCYQCYAFGGGFQATKGSDTVLVNGFSWQGIQDSVNHYTNLGCTLGPVLGGYTPALHNELDPPCNWDYLGPQQFDSCVPVWN